MSYRQNITKHIKLTESMLIKKQKKKKQNSKICRFFWKKKTFSRRFKVALSGLRHFLATDNTFKVMKNAVYITLKALFFFR